MTRTRIILVIFAVIMFLCAIAISVRYNPLGQLKASTTPIEDDTPPFPPPPIRPAILSENECNRLYSLCADSALEAYSTCLEDTSIDECSRQLQQSLAVCTGERDRCRGMVEEGRNACIEDCASDYNATPPPIFDCDVTRHADRGTCYNSSSQCFNNCSSARTRPSDETEAECVDRCSNVERICLEAVDAAFYECEEQNDEDRESHERYRSCVQYCDDAFEGW